jgi:hypothetical protein
VHRYPRYLIASDVEAHRIKWHNVATVELVAGHIVAGCKIGVKCGRVTAQAALLTHSIQLFLGIISFREWIPTAVSSPREVLVLGAHGMLDAGNVQFRSATIIKMQSRHVRERIHALTRRNVAKFCELELAALLEFIIVHRVWHRAACHSTR